ncbi:MAG: hypothetical protein ABIP55_00075 [Tepidisphaeraceae bacterium]
MILAGIDEAGYGPLLGPLVVGCCAFEISGIQARDAELPCVWKRLKKLVSKQRSKNGKKLHINDSKVVYRGSDEGGLREVERAVLAILLSGSQTSNIQHPTSNVEPENAKRDLSCLDDLLGRVAGHAIEDLRRYPWYQPFEGEKFPLEQELLPVRLFSNALKAEMETSGARCVHLAARVVSERKLNDLIGATRNKASALFSTAAIHLDYLLRTYGQSASQGGLTIFCDRQGGRTHYGSLLRLMFGNEAQDGEGWELEISSETEARADYRLRRRGSEVRILFCEKAEEQCLPVAAASMLSKYLREALMHRFNAYWKRLLPSVKPTAGYYTDGVRFLGDIQLKRAEMGIADELLIRSR